MVRNRCLAILLPLLLGTVPAAHAHPVPRRNHDRTIAVHLAADARTGQPMVRVSYRLEVDEFTVVYEDLPALGDNVPLSKLRTPQEFYDAFTRGYAPILAGNLVATFDAQPLRFRCVQQSHTLRDEQGAPLGHLRCDFVFEADPPPAASAPGREHRFTFAEKNYEFEEGLIRVSLAVEGPVQLVSKTEPDAALQGRPLADLGPGDEAKIRQVAAAFRLPGPAPAATGPAASPAPSPEPAAQAAAPEEPTPAPGPRHSLLGLLLDSQQGFWGLMFLAACFGAAHALTPGHGKTLVAAYLVGERGTAGHALLLGLVTTLTHTGAVLVLAAVLLALFPRAVPRDVQAALGLVGGLLVAGLGLWLLLRRLSGGADHVHLGGHGHGHPHHHHHHGAADHYHDEHGHAHPLPVPGKAVGWGDLIVLGISGGIVPCWDAIIMLGFAISAQRLWLGLPLLVAFSAGLAAVLIAIGLAVVYAKGFASSRWGESRLVRALPLLSAVLVTALGLWLCYDTVHSAPPAAASPLPRP